TKDPNEDTEWNDILRDFGILPPKEEVKDEIEEMEIRLQQQSVVKLFECPYIFTVSHLNFANGYDTKELKALQKRQRFGELKEIAGNQYVKEVTNAPKDVWVVIHLYNASIPMCALVNRYLSLLAIKFPETKFVKAIAKSCIENYHDNCLPTIFVYKDGKIEGKLIGVVECGGTALTVEDLEWKLAEFGAIKTDLEENPRKGIKDMMMSSLRKASMDDN
uniref:Phosducin like 2 n=1 Tax=Pseudonaja textilis TaxID=8673 RepID=A0A670YC78_PSETE